MMTQHVAPTGAGFNNSRRSLFGGMAAAAAVGLCGMATAPNPDARLIALCDEIVRRNCSATKGYFTRCDAAELPGEMNAALAAMKVQHEIIDDLIDEAAELTATTADGRAAKARAVRVWIGTWSDDYAQVELSRIANPHERLAWSLMNDLTAGRA